MKVSFMGGNRVEEMSSEGSGDTIGGDGGPGDGGVGTTGGAAAALRRVLREPIYNKTLRKDVGRGELDYEIYLRTGALLALQTDADALVVPDEMLFQIVHQTQELWLKCAAFEATHLVDALERDAPFDALGALDRIVPIVRSMNEQIRILDTLPPSRFHVIRRSLGNGSGLESPGYNRLLAAAAAAWAAVERLLARRSATLLEVYGGGELFPDLYRICDRLVDWDAAVQAWLVEHFMLVRRTLGIDKTVRALDGFPTAALSARMTRPLFPALWAIRVEMSQTWSRDGGFAPGADRGDHPESSADVATTQASRSVPAACAVVAPHVPVWPEAHIRSQFPLVERCVYLNSNATGATPRVAKRVLDDYWHTIERWRDEVWQHYWWHELRTHADEVAALIGAPAGSVVCDTNLSTLLARVLSCFDYRQRPRIVTTDLEFPSMGFVLHAFSRYGAATTVIQTADGVAIDAEQVAGAIDERTQLVCLSHATFATGALLDVGPIVRRAREVGALVALDVYQSAGAVPIDVTALDIDFALGGAHKWLCGSYESAFLYVRPALLARLEPAATGWIASSDPLSFAPQMSWAIDARRFASGTPAVLPALMSRPGLAIVREIGVPAIRRLSLSRTDRIIARADEAGLTVVTPRPHDRRGGIVALRFAGDADAARQLVAAGFICSYRGGLRIAPHFYNSDDEVDRFMSELIRLAHTRTGAA